MPKLIVADHPDLTWLRDLCTDPRVDGGPYQLPPLPQLRLPAQGLVIGGLAVIHHGVVPDLVVRPASEAIIRHALTTFYLRPVQRIRAVPLAVLTAWCELPAPVTTVCSTCNGLGYLTFGHADDREEAAILAGEMSDELAGTPVKAKGVSCDTCDGAGRRTLRGDGYGRLGPLTVDRRALAPLLAHVRGGVLTAGVTDVMIGVNETLDHNPQREVIAERRDLYLAADTWRVRLYPVDPAATPAPELP
jgi:hypothetical protein